MGRALLLILALSLTSESFAAEALTWTEAAQRALAGNIELRAEAERIRARHSALYARYGEYMPSLALVGAKSEANTAIEGQISKKRADEYGAEAKWSIFSGFSTAASVDRAKAEEAGQEAVRETARVDVRYELRIAFFQALAALENAQLYRRIRDRQREHVSMMRLKYSSGAEALWSLRKAEADFDEAEEKLKSEESQLARALDRVNFLLGLDGGVEVAVTGKAEDFLVPNMLSAEGIKGHPELKRSEARTDSATAGIRLARADFYPRIAAAYSYKKQKNDPMPDRVSVSTIGINVELPVFDGLSTRRNVESASSEREAALLEQESLRRSLEQSYRSAAREYESKLRRVPVAARIHAAARDRARVVSEQYKLGLKRFLDWEQAQAKLIEAERDEIQAKLAALLALASLERAYGLRLGDG